MALDPISSGFDLITNIITRVWPDRTQQDLEKLKAAMQANENLVKLLTGQMDVNAAEAANPNRKWMTWRELLGYVLVISVTYQWVILPLLTYIGAVTNHPIAVKDLFTIDILDMLYLLCGMLGLDVGPILANKVRGRKI